MWQCIGDTQGKIADQPTRTTINVSSTFVSQVEFLDGLRYVTMHCRYYQVRATSCILFWIRRKRWHALKNEFLWSLSTPPLRMHIGTSVGKIMNFPNTFATQPPTRVGVALRKGQGGPTPNPELHANQACALCCDRQLWAAKEFLYYDRSAWASTQMMDVQYSGRREVQTTRQIDKHENYRYATSVDV